MAMVSAELADLKCLINWGTLPTRWDEKSSHMKAVHNSL